MFRGLIGKVFALALGLLAVLSMAPGPKSARQGDTARKAALSEMLKTAPRDADRADKSGEIVLEPKAGAQAAKPAPGRTITRNVAFPTGQSTKVALGARDAPSEYLARMQTTHLQAERSENRPDDANGLLRVTASAVNLRSGPTTGSRILGRLVRGQDAEMIRDMGNGWAEIRVPHTGKRGFVALRFLAPVGG